MRALLRPALIALLLAGCGGARDAARLPADLASIDWNEPFPPHRVIGELYYVGTAPIASFLFATPEGHILVNSGFESTVSRIRASVEQLGFRFEDVEILLGSHAHADHMEGDARVEQLSGARVMAMEQDVPLLRELRPGGKRHPIDRVLRDGDRVELGGTTLVAHRTGGHTPGCTTWTARVAEGGRTYDVLILCSVGVNPDYVLVDNPDYPEIARDYERSFALLRALPVDVFLGAHGFFYGLAEKHARLGAGGANPFLDPAGYRAHLDLQERRFRERLAEQRRAARR